MLLLAILTIGQPLQVCTVSLCETLVKFSLLRLIKKLQQTSDILDDGNHHNCSLTEDN